MTPGIFVDRIVQTTQHFDPAVIRADHADERRARATSRAARADGGALGLPPDLMALRVAAPAARRRVRQPRHRAADVGLELHRRPRRHAALGERHPRLTAPSRAEGEEDLDLYNASGQLVTPLPETSYFDSTLSFAMARTGRVSTIVLGALPGGGERRPGQLEHALDRRRRHRRRHGSRRRRRPRHRDAVPAASATARRSWSSASPTRRRRSAACRRWSPTWPDSTSTPTASCCGRSRRACASTRCGR